MSRFSEDFGQNLMLILPKHQLDKAYKDKQFSSEFKVIVIFQCDMINWNVHVLSYTSLQVRLWFKRPAQSTSRSPDYFRHHNNQDIVTLCDTASSQASSNDDEEDSETDEDDCEDEDEQGGY